MKGELKMKERKIIKLLMLCTVLTLGLCLASSWAMAATPCTDPNGHVWEYMEGGSYLVAECENCKLSACLILSAENEVYDGNPAEYCVSITDAMRKWTVELGDLPEICYYKDDGTPLTSAPVDVGTYIAKISAGSGPLEQKAKVSFDILPKSILSPVLITAACDYDGSKHNLSSFIEKLEYNYVNVYVNDTTSDEYMDAGEYTVKFTLKDPVNTTWANGSNTELIYHFYVRPVPLIIQATSRNATVGDNAPDLSNPQIDYDYKTEADGGAAIQDLKNGRLQISLDASFPVNSDNELNEEGTYTISPKISGSAAKNYTFYADDGTLTVTSDKKAQIPAFNVTTFIYNGTTHEFMTSPRPDDLYRASGPLSATDVGQYSVVLKLKDGAKWSDGTTENKTYMFEILPAPLVVQVKNKIAAVGGTAPSLKNAVEGTDFAYLRDPAYRSGIDVSLSYETTPDMTQAGSTKIKATVSGQDAANYQITTADGELIVQAAGNPSDVPIPVLGNTNFLYDGNEQTFMTVASDAGYIATAGSTLKATDVGTYNVTLQLKDKTNTTWSDGTTEDKKYTFEILTASLIVQVTNKSATVGELPPDLTKAQEGTDYIFIQRPATSDLGKITASLNYQDSNLTNGRQITLAGNYEISATIQGARATNYSCIVVPGTLAVQAAGDPGKVLIPVLTNTNFLYDGTEKTFMTVASDAGYTVAAGSTLKATDVGTYQVTLQLKDQTNTTWSDGSTKDKVFTFEIWKAPLFVQAKNKITSVGDTAPDLKSAAEGTDYTFLKLPASGDTITVSLSYASTPDMSQAGTTAIKATVSGADASNYEIVTADGMLVVQAAGDPGTVLIPVLTSNNFLYDGTEQTFMTVSADAGYKATTDSTLKGKNVGTYHVTLQLKDKANTTWSDGSTTDKDYTFKIWKAPLVVHVKDKSASVGATAPDLKNAVQGTDYTFLRAPMGGDKINVSLNYAATPDMSQEGTTAIRANVTGQNIENYDVIVAEGTLTVVPDDSPEPPLYAMTQGVNSEWDTGSSEDARFRSTAPYAKFQDVLVDEQLVDPSNYTVSEGSTIIDLKPKFLKMLAAGRHKITIRSTDGKVSCYFWIKNPLPGTGDTSNLPLWLSLFAAATAAGILLMKKRKAN